MGTGEIFSLGMVANELEEANELQEESNRLARERNRLLNSDVQTIRKGVIQELVEKGTLLPKYDWQDKEFNDTLEAITADWFTRHPETKRGTGEFDKKYPEKATALGLMERMGAMGRITPEEYIVIYKEIFNF